MLKAARRPLILCVEDEPLLLRDLCEELEEAGYQTIGVPDVPAALLVLSRLTPALILCDVGLPGQSGLDLLAELRDNDALPDVPFLLLTALNDRDSLLRGTRAGADDYLVKPVDYDLLLASVASKLAQVMRLQRQHRSQLQRHLDDAHLHWYGVLDSLGHCALVCDAQLAVHFANRHAYALCHGSSLQGPSQASPIVIDAAGNLALRQSLAQHPALWAVLRSQQDSASIEVPAVPGSAPLWRLAVQTLTAIENDSNQTAVDLRNQRFVLFISDLQQAVKPGADALARRFTLTPSETEVASLLVDGLSRQQIGDRLQVSTTTVAYHLRNLFAKTHTGRQAELVAVLLTAAVAAPAVPAAAAV